MVCASYFICIYFIYFRAFFASGALDLTEKQLECLVKKYSTGQAFVLRMVCKSTQYYLFKHFIESNASPTPEKNDQEEKSKTEKMILKNANQSSACIL